jgi:neutral ceramidase
LRSPFKIMFPVGYANDFAGHVPTEEALGPRGGGYETRLTSCSNLEVKAGPEMVEAALEMAGQMKPGKLPEGKQASSGKPWPYGNVPPELD